MRGAALEKHASLRAQQMEREIETEVLPAVFFRPSGMHLLGIDKDAVPLLKIQGPVQHPKMKVSPDDGAELRTRVPVPVDDLISVRGKFLSQKLKWESADFRFDPLLQSSFNLDFLYGRFLFFHEGKTILSDCLEDFRYRRRNCR